MAKIHNLLQLGFAASCATLTEDRIELVPNQEMKRYFTQNT